MRLPRHKLTDADRSNGGKAAQKRFKERGSHPLDGRNFWDTCTKKERQRHREARAARAKAERAVLGIARYLREQKKAQGQA